MRDVLASVRVTTYAVLALLGLDGCGGDRIASDDSDAAVDTAGPECSDAFASPGGGYGFWFIEHDSTAREWMLAKAKRLRSRFNDRGATRANALWEMQASDGNGVVPELAIEAQRSGVELIAGGLAELVDDPSHTVNTDAGSLLDIGLAAIEWGLAQKSKTTIGPGDVPCNNINHPDDPPNTTKHSWPCERGGTKSGAHSLHPKTEFIEAAASGLALIIAASAKYPLPASYLDRIARAKEQLAAVGGWLAAQSGPDGDVTAFRAGITDGPTYDPLHANFNQQLWVAVALFKIGVVLDDASYVQTATDWMGNDTYGALDQEQVLPDITPAQSALPENAIVGLYGFDASYQTVSMELLIKTIGDLPPDSTFRNERLLPVLKRAYRRFDAALVKPAQDTWLVDGAHEHNTRTCECGDRQPLAGELDMPLRMLRYQRLLGASCHGDVATKAKGLVASGQTFTHYQDCSEPGEDDGGLCRSP